MDEAVAICAGIRTGGDKDKVEAESQNLRKSYESAQAELEVLRQQRAKEGPPRDAIEVVSLRKEADRTHTQPMQGPDGAWWYREPAPGLDLGHCEAYSLGGTENAAYGYRAVVKDSYVDDFAAWCEKRKGQYFGLASDGYLMYVDRMPGKLVDELNRLTLVLEPVDVTTSPAPEVVHDEEKPRVEISVATEYAKAVVLDSEYLRIIEMRDSEDPTHANEIKDDDGKTWYLSPDSGFHLGHFDFPNAEVSGSLDGQYRLCVRIRDDARAEFSEWCQKHSGKPVGVILDGHLLHVWKMTGHAPSVVELKTYSDWDAAMKGRNALRKGGEK
jgi:hypothetical protein